MCIYIYIANDFAHARIVDAYLHNIAQHVTFRHKKPD